VIPDNGVDSRQRNGRGRRVGGPPVGAARGARAPGAPVSARTPRRPGIVHVLGGDLGCPWPAPVPR